MPLWSALRAASVLVCGEVELAQAVRVGDEPGRAD